MKSIKGKTALVTGGSMGLGPYVAKFLAQEGVNIGRIIVNPGLVWPMQILDAIHPGIMSWILRKFGVYDWYRAQAEENLKQR